MSCRLSGARDCFSSGYRVGRACGAFVLNKFRPSGTYKAVESPMPSVTATKRPPNSAYLVYPMRQNEADPLLLGSRDPYLATHEKPLGEALHEVEANSVGKP